jgi:hypothetical protein
VPAYVEDELRNYLECGLFCFGFARAVCMTCRTGFVVAFFCKGRGVCPSCNGRHMAQTAAHLVDHVIPPVPVRQWVISVPKRLRGMLADRPRAVAALTRIFLDEIERLLCAAAGVTRAANNPRPERPHHARPLRAAQAQSRHLGRARPRPQVHAPGGQWRHRTHAVCRQDAGPAVQPNLGFGCDRPRRQGPGMALPPECQLNRLADLVPPPRKHRHRYHGVFAPNHKLRRAVTALAVGRGLARVPQEQVPVPGCRKRQGNTGKQAQGNRDRHRLLRSRSQSLARHLADCLGETPGPGG